MMALIRAARAHTEHYILSSFIEKVLSIHDASIQEVLSRLCFLFALTSIASPISQDNASFIEDAHLSQIQLRDMRSHIDTILEELLPDAIAITDAFNFTDASLATAIGCRDGDAYRRLMTWTKQLPMNVQARQQGGAFVDGFEGFIRPFLAARDVVDQLCEDERE